MKVKVQGLNKDKTEEMEISPKIFSIESNPKLLSQVVLSQLSSIRQPIAHTKNRGEVSGGGRKPFRQKGTGQARAGSTRSPLWRGGGITFGPRKTRNYKQRLPQKMFQKAIFMALSEKVKEKRLIIVPEFKFTSIKTKQVQDFLEKLPIEEGKILVILAKTNANFELSAANLPYLKVIQAENINILDLLKYEYLLTDKEGLKKIEGIFKAKS